ncbi:hypothetical protein GY45DRAFT_1398229 [Cubamyces sp. BRFM 1775]|nr:hypothetical protein GY45DRAFT_1398229 [Cubamyces sp. BRFM 1775]
MSAQDFSDIISIYAGLSLDIVLQPIIAQWLLVLFCIVALTSIETGMEYIQYLFWAGFSALHVYALQRKSSYAALVFICSLSPAFASLVGYHWLQPYSPTEGCVEQEILPQWYHYSDILVNVITWKTQFSSWKFLWSSSNTLPLTKVLLYNALLVLEMLQIFSTYGSYNTSNLAIFNETITAIVVSTFISDLRKAADSKTYQGSLSSMGALESRIIGPLGASLSSPADNPLEYAECAVVQEEVPRYEFSSIV